ncbi:MAG TPA: hypothetical protein VI564_08630 [Candidatus Nanoarchaeia archaeon]|nr:hypothetical protein [Candidatus Nanoarchaeia archaeon]
MTEKSAFLEIEGSSPKNKVLDFLIVSQDFDYSLKDIAKFSNVSYPSVKQLKKELLKDKWITLVRKVGRAQMYRLNIKNKKVQKFIEFYWAVVDEQVERNLGIKNKQDFGANTSIAVSAKNV